MVPPNLFVLGELIEELPAYAEYTAMQERQKSSKQKEPER